MIGEISAASSEQPSGIEQINQAVAQLDSVTRRGPQPRLLPAADPCGRRPRLRQTRGASSKMCEAPVPSQETNLVRAGDGRGRRGQAMRRHRLLVKPVGSADLVKVIRQVLPGA